MFMVSYCRFRSPSGRSSAGIRGMQSAISAVSMGEKLSSGGELPVISYEKVEPIAWAHTPIEPTQKHPLGERKRPFDQH